MWQCKWTMVWFLLCLFPLSSASFAPEFEIPDDTMYTVKVNESVLLPCHVTNQRKELPNQRFLFHWSKNDDQNKQVVWQWHRYKIMQNKGLKIRHLTVHDSGTYYCNAQSMVAGKQKVARKLIVVGNSTDPLPPVRAQPTRPSPPIPFIFERDELRVSKKLVEKIFHTDTRGKLRCAIKGLPIDSVDWYFNNSILVSDSNSFSLNDPRYSLPVRKKSLVLLIANMTASDSGNYTCVARNQKHAVRMYFKVKVKVPYADTLPPVVMQTVYADQGDNVTFECAVAAREVNLLRWHSGKTRDKDAAFRQRDVGKALGEQEDEPIVRNHTKIQIIKLVNVTRALHQGVYNCLALFKKSQKATTVRIVNLIIVTSDTHIEPTQPDNQSPEARTTLLLMIGVPVIAGFLSMFIIMTCIRRHKQKLMMAKRETEQTQPSDEVMVKLPNEPTGSLYLHMGDKKETLCMQQYPETCQTFFVDPSKPLKANSDSKLNSVNKNSDAKSKRVAKHSDTNSVNKNEVRSNSLPMKSCDSQNNSIQSNNCESNSNICEKNPSDSFKCKKPCRRKSPSEGEANKLTDDCRQSLLNKNSSSRCKKSEIKDDVEKLPQLNNKNNTSSRCKKSEPKKDSITEPPPTKSTSSEKQTWPGERLSPSHSDYMDFGDDERLLYRKNENSTSKSDNSLENCSLLSNNENCGLLSNTDNAPLDDIYSDDEKDDNVLNREIKNWELLLKSRSPSYNKTSKGLSQIL